MAFYTGQSQLNLPRTPDSYSHHFTMNAATAALPSLRAAEFLTWSTWRASSSKHPQDSAASTPLTPPMTSTFQSRTAYSSSSTGHFQPPPAPSIPVDEMELDDEESEEEEEERYEVVPEHEDESRMTLPPIAHLERHLHNLPPLTPPDDIPHHQAPPRIALPKIATTHTDAEFFQAKHMAVPMLQYDVGHSPSSQKISSMTTSKEYYHDINHLAPPSSVPPHQSSSSTTNASEQTGLTPNTSAAAATTITTLALAPAPPSYLVDWLDFTRTRSAHFVAEKTCEMICYLWFSIPSHAKKSVEGSPTPGSSLLEDPKSAMNSVSALQLVATPAFVSFLQKLLETTQVSQSVIVLSLHYIHRLKEKNRYMPAQPGSEFRIAVAGLMMANKFLDDNTYTNKTWAEVSGISLNEINRMEREFLLGVDFNLYVDKMTYASWLNLLKGLVLAKERDARRLLRGSTHGSRGANSARRAAAAVAASSFRTGRDRDGKFWHPHQPPTQHYQQQAAQGGYQSYARPQQGAPTHASSGPTSRTYTTHAAAANAISQSTSRSYRHRARSTSPQAFTFSSNASRVVSHPPAYTNRDPELSSLHAQLPQSPERSAYTHLVSNTQTHLHTPSSPTPSSLQIPHSTTTTGSKRSAAAAFASPSPSSAAHIFHTPTYATKRQAPYSNLHGLQIPDFDGAAPHRSNPGSNSVGMNDPSPLEGLHGFERMTLAVPPVDNSERERGREYLGRRGRLERDDRIEDTRQAKRVKSDPRATISTSNVNTVVPETLVAAYSADAAGKVTLPKNLFFYTLASSPNADEKQRERETRQQQRDLSMEPSETSMDSDDVPYAYSDSKTRKARLRYQAAQPIKHGYDYADLNAFGSRGAPLYTYPTSSTQSTSSSAERSTPISPVPALVHARYIPHSTPYMLAPLSASSPSTSPSYTRSHASSTTWPTQVQHSTSHDAQAVVPVRVLPAVAQSVTTSPVMTAAPASNSGVQHLPHFHDDVWAAPPLPADQNQSHWYRNQHRTQQDDHVMGRNESPVPSPTGVPNSTPYRHQFPPSTSNPPSSLPGSANSSPFHHRDVPSAPFANAGPPGVVTQFYSTPEVQQVHMPQIPAIYSAYAAYSAYGSSSSGLGGSIAGVVTGGTPVHQGSTRPQRPHVTTAPSGSVPSHATGYTYSGAHSTSNSPYHSASTSFSRYDHYANYPGQPSSNSSIYGRY